MTNPCVANPPYMGRSVDDWLATEDNDEWSQMMRKVAAFHHKHDFA